MKICYIAALLIILVACNEPALQKNTTINCSTASDAVLDGYKGNPAFVSQKIYRYKDSMGIQVIDQSDEQNKVTRYDRTGQIIYCKYFGNGQVWHEQKFTHVNGITKEIRFIEPGNPEDKSFTERIWIDSFSFKLIKHTILNHPRIGDTDLISEKHYQLDKQCRHIKSSDTGGFTSISNHTDINRRHTYRVYKTGEKGWEYHTTIIARDKYGNPLKQIDKDADGNMVTLILYTYEYY